MGDYRANKAYRKVFTYSFVSLGTFAYYNSSLSHFHIGTNPNPVNAALICWAKVHGVGQWIFVETKDAVSHIRCCQL
jgi:hypothetical protein